MNDMKNFILNYGNSSEKQKMFELLTKTYVFPINTFDDLKNLPESVIDAVISYRLIYPHPNFEKLNTTLEKVYPEYNFSSEQLKNINRSTLRNLQSLGQEQAKYLFGIKSSDENKNDILRRNIKLHSECNIWFVMASLDDIPYGGIFVFQNKDNLKDVMIQGISKFTIPYIFSILYPDISTLFPKLNSLLLPVVEEIAHNNGGSRIIVNPIGEQGRILEKYYDFYSIAPVDYVCNIISKSYDDTFLAKNLKN